jgi:hypothetical protein
VLEVKAQSDSGDFVVLGRWASSGGGNTELDHDELTEGWTSPALGAGSAATLTVIADFQSDEEITVSVVGQVKDSGGAKHGSAMRCTLTGKHPDKQTATFVVVAVPAP